MTSSILAIHSISFKYDPGRPAAINSVSFEILPGTVTAILGPNGAGKTTLLHLLLGLKNPVSGKILLEGKELGLFSRRELSQWIGLVPQSEYMPFEYTVLDYVLLGRAPYLGPLELPQAGDTEIARKALVEIGIEHLKDRPVPALSGGEMQLVTLARALCQQPRILLLDEPTSHLDLSNRNATLRILNNLRRNGTTIIFTTHDPESAVLIADHVVLMRNGQVLDTGDMDTIFTGEKLSRAYGTRVQVLQVDGLMVVKSMERLQ